MRFESWVYSAELAKNFQIPCPYTSTRRVSSTKRQPKNIRDWNDLTKPGAEIITLTLQNGWCTGRWFYLSAWGYALKQPGGNDVKLESCEKALSQCESSRFGARGSLTTFAERGIGDVLLSWENEALLATKGPDKDKYQIVYPSVSLLAEPSVAIVDKTVDKDGNRTLAKGYLNFYIFTFRPRIGC